MTRPLQNPTRLTLLNGITVVVFFIALIFISYSLYFTVFLRTDPYAHPHPNSNRVIDTSNPSSSQTTEMDQLLSKLLDMSLLSSSVADQLIQQAREASINQSLHPNIETLLQQPFLRPAGDIQDYHMGEARGNPIIISGFYGVHMCLLTELLSFSLIPLPSKLTSSCESVDFLTELGTWLESSYEKSPWNLNGTTQVSSFAQLQIEAIIQSFEEKLTLKRFMNKHHFELERTTNVKTWGFQSHKALYLLPELKKRFPNMVLIHVIEDPLYISMDNRRSVWEFMQDIFQIMPPNFLSPHRGVQFFINEYVRLWRVTTTQVYKWASKHLGGKYMIVRIEDFCTDEIVFVQRILRKLGIKSPRNLQSVVEDLAVKQGSSLEWLCMKSRRNQEFIQKYGLKFIHEMRNGSERELRLFRYNDF
eukprot:TRINITY_DN6055_c0_g1_i4.p1 TRINITY_DN6055_c0_g1~~TRINITY_DN6055_c0_g1_i4.p1  ORF type:complete len:418 (-),score=79.74 TRINITY_DN6055_c0_g1_i4:122-1375(-)